jgi:hypothetical protein
MVVCMINQSRHKLPDVVGLRWMSLWLYRFVFRVDGTVGYITDDDSRESKHAALE